MTFHIVGLDLSLTATGIASIRPETDDQIRVATITSQKVANAGYPDTLDRIRTICAKIIAWIRNGREDGDVTIVVIEGPVFAGSFNGQYHTRAGLWWMIVHLLSKEASVIVVEPTKLKSYVARKGTADKAAMVAAISRNFPDVWITDDNQADALGLASMAARELGYPQEPSVQRCNPGALAGVDWPDWIRARRV